MSSSPFRRLRRTLTNLDSTQAFLLFFVAAVVAAISIVFDFGSPYLSVGVVVLYGLVLLNGQNRHYVQLSPITKDSPYFLGFTLTLVALIAIFHKLSSGPVGTEIGTSYLFHGAAAALGTTIAGVILRQALYTSDPVERDRDDIFQTLAEELKDQTTSFAQSQRRLVDLIKEFVSSREQLFTREESAFRQYVERLEAASNSLSKLEKSYTGQLAEALNELTTYASDAVKNGEESARQLRSARDGLAAMLERHREGLDELHTANQRLIEDTRTGLIQGAERLQAVTTQLVSAVQNSTTQIGAIPDKHREAAAAIGTAAQQVAGPIQRIGEDLTGIHGRLQSLSDQLGRIPHGLESSVQELDRTTQQREQLVGERLSELLKDLEALDDVVDQVSALLQRRITGDGDMRRQ